MFEACKVELSMVRLSLSSAMGHQAQDHGQPGSWACSQESKWSVQGLPCLEAGAGSAREQSPVCSRPCPGMASTRLGTVMTGRGCWIACEHQVPGCTCLEACLAGLGLFNIYGVLLELVTHPPSEAAPSRVTSQPAMQRVQPHFTIQAARCQPSEPLRLRGSAGLGTSRARGRGKGRAEGHTSRDCGPLK